METAQEPSSAHDGRQLGAAVGFAGGPEEALAAAENAERGSPRDPERFHVIQCQSCAHFVAGRLEEAYRKSRQAARLQPNFYASYAFMSATAGLLGKEDEAKAAARSFPTPQTKSTASTSTRALCFGIQ